MTSTSGGGSLADQLLAMLTEAPGLVCDVAVVVDRPLSEVAVELGRLQSADLVEEVVDQNGAWWRAVRCSVSDGTPRSQRDELDSVDERQDAQRLVGSV